MRWADGKIRCHWVNPANTTYLRYHDDEWGRLVHDDHILHICQVDKFLGDEDKKGLACLERLRESCACGRRLNLKTERRCQRWLFVLKTVFGT